MTQGGNLCPAGVDASKMLLLSANSPYLPLIVTLMIFLRRRGLPHEAVHTECQRRTIAHLLGTHLADKRNL
jgi:hypothetical protein